MTTEQAVAELATSIDPPSVAPDADAIRTVLNRLAELERIVGEPVGTEWAITWPDGDVEEGHSDKDSAERAARAAGDGVYVVSAPTYRGPWTVAS